MHYTATVYQRLLAARGATASMSRTGDCWDNAVVESFFATLKTELINDAKWRSRADAIRGLGHYIDWYNQRRLHSTLNYMSPAAFERQLSAA